MNFAMEKGMVGNESQRTTKLVMDIVDQDRPATAEEQMAMAYRPSQLFKMRDALIAKQNEMLYDYDGFSEYGIEGVSNMIEAHKDQLAGNMYAAQVAGPFAQPRHQPHAIRNSGR